MSVDGRFFAGPRGFRGVGRLPDFVVLGQERWDEVERRNQLLIGALAARHARARFLFVEQALRPRDVREWRLPRIRRVAANIWCMRPIRPVPDAASRPAGDLAECLQIEQAMRRLGLQDPLLWTQDPRAATLIDRLPIGGIVYDLTDDWAAFEDEPVRRSLVQQRIESLGRAAQLVFACSRALETEARRWSNRVQYLPNAVEPPSSDSTIPLDLEEIPRPRMGYAGTLHSVRLDVELLASAAARRPDWSFVFIGPDLLDDSDRSRLYALPNIHYLGVRPHAAIRSYLFGFDVCLLPNRVTEFTQSLDPLKVYEYLAAGRPVVATPAGVPVQLEEHVNFATGVDEFLEQAQRAYDEDAPSLSASRRAAVAEDTWEDRAATVERALGITPLAHHRAAVSVVVVSFNTRDLLARCLRALREQHIEQQVIVVDNASTDGSRELVREQFPEVELIELAENTGFAHANNVGFRLCQGEYVLLVNSDAFLHPGCLRELLAAATRHPRAGVVGPRLVNATGSLQRSAWPFPRAGRLILEALALHRPLRRLGLLEDLGIWPHDTERAVDFLVGACLLLRMDALTDVIGFDESFWLYGEEADLQRRLRARGWSVVFAPRAVATHVGGASSVASATRLQHFYAGQARFLRRHQGRVASATARVALLVGSLLRGRWTAARVAVELRPFRDEPDVRGASSPQIAEADAERGSS